MRIVHVFRSPVGGLFRHVCDVVRGQAALGHEIGIYCDSSTGSVDAELALQLLQPFCPLGIARRAMSTWPGFNDVSNALHLKNHLEHLGAHIVHGHGAKGGLYSRLAARVSGLPSVYSPHGGSLHYDWQKLPGPLFLGSELALRFKGSGFIFVCAFEKHLFERKIGFGGRPATVVHNGLWPEEFIRPPLDADATDLLFVGEMRALKGVDVLLHTLALLQPQRPATLTLVGEGRDKAKFQRLAKDLQLQKVTRFVGRHSMGEALKMGRQMVMPSRNESFPYVVLECVAAGVPIIASDVGGIAEVLPAAMLCAAGNPEALAAKLLFNLREQELAATAALDVQNDARNRFSAQLMVKDITSFYSQLLNN